MQNGWREERRRAVDPAFVRVLRRSAGGGARDERRAGRCQPFFFEPVCHSLTVSLSNLSLVRRKEGGLYAKTQGRRISARRREARRSALFGCRRLPLFARAPRRRHRAPARSATRPHNREIHYRLLPPRSPRHDDDALPSRSARDDGDALPPRSPRDEDDALAPRSPRDKDDKDGGATTTTRLQREDELADAELEVVLRGLGVIVHDGAALR